MNGALGLWDALFGEKVEIELQDGLKRRVTRKWLDKMVREGNAHLASATKELGEAAAPGDLRSKGLLHSTFDHPESLGAHILRGVQGRETRESPFGEPTGIDIVRPSGFPIFFSGFCFQLATHALERYNTAHSGECPTGDHLYEESLADFRQDFTSSGPVRDNWMEEFLSSEEYEARLFLETLYYAIFRSDFLMQSGDEGDVYVPVRGNCVHAIDNFLVHGLGYGNTINEINRAIAARCNAYAEVEAKASLLFAANVLELTAVPEVFALRTHAYMWVASLNMLLPIFMNRAHDGDGVQIKCRRCGTLVAPRIERTPSTIRCHNCAQEYRVRRLPGRIS